MGKVCKYRGNALFTKFTKFFQYICPLSCDMFADETSYYFIFLQYVCCNGLAEFFSLLFEKSYASNYDTVNLQLNTVLKHVVKSI
jgi:hypothetical protein